MSRLYPPSFVTVFTGVCPLSVSSATWIQAILFHPNCVRSILILCFQLWLILPVESPHLCLLTKMHCISCVSHPCYMPCSSHSLFVLPSTVWCSVPITTLLFHAVFSKHSSQCPVLRPFRSMKSDQMSVIIGLYAAVMCRNLNHTAEFLICQHVSDGCM